MEQWSTDPADLILENFGLRKELRLLVSFGEKVLALLPQSSLENDDAMRSIDGFGERIRVARSLLVDNKRPEETPKQANLF